MTFDPNAEINLSLPFGHCGYAPDIGDAEFEGIRWLMDTLERIVNKGRGHRSYTQACATVNFIKETIDCLERLHDEAHTHDKKVADLEKQLRIVTRRCETLEALVEETDEDRSVHG